MTVKELIDLLKCERPDDRVVLSSDGCLLVEIQRIANPMDRSWTIDEGSIAILGDDC